VCSSWQHRLSGIKKGKKRKEKKRKEKKRKEMKKTATGSHFTHPRELIKQTNAPH
jgi:hypothetical protein